ncbi:MAG: acetyl-CoA hydrolase/transferase family protein [Candidatus Saccharibacteria bacterium]
MGFFEEYHSKLCTPQEAVRIVKSGDWIDYGSFNGKPVALDQALAARANELEDIKIRGVYSMTPVQAALSDPERKSFLYNTWHMSGLERELHDRNICNYIPIALHEVDKVYSGLTTNVAMLAVSPMDNRGFFNVGPQALHSRTIVNNARYILLEINKNMPVALGGNDELIHISEVNHVVETDNPHLAQVKTPSPDDIEMAIAERVIEEIIDGCCLQLGIGTLPNLIGKMIAASGFRHLGIHTDILVDSVVDMYDAGCIDGTRKATDPRKIVYSFAIGTQKLYTFLNNNPVCSIHSGSYTNNPLIAARNPYFVAINNCLEVDLYGQIASEALEGRNISGGGGQLDFVKIGYMSRSGKGIVCLTSTYKDKEGRVMSRIRPALGSGTVTTLPRNMTHYVATEWGVVNLKGRSSWERAEMLVSIAHPNFRDELIREADRLKIWVKSNKISH